MSLAEAFDKALRSDFQDNIKTVLSALHKLPTDQDGKKFFFKVDNSAFYNTLTKETTPLIDVWVFYTRQVHEFSNAPIYSVSVLDDRDPFSGIKHQVFLARGPEPVLRILIRGDNKGNTSRETHYYTQVDINGRPLMNGTEAPYQSQKADNNDELLYNIGYWAAGVARHRRDEMAATLPKAAQDGLSRKIEPLPMISTTKMRKPKNPDA